MNITLLSKKDIQQCITMKDAIDTMRAAFLKLAKGEVLQPLRCVIPVQSKGATLTMPAYLHKQQLGVKIVSSFPENFTHRLPCIHGVIVLLDTRTGVPIAFMEAGYLTALRTGAISGLATDLLAREDARQLCIIGSGIQAYTQLEAIRAVRNIEKITVWSRTFKHAKTFVESFNNQLNIEPIESIQAAVRKADIICTATSSTTPFLHYPDLKQNVHINAIGSHSKSMQEIGLDILQKAMIVVDQKNAALMEAGELINAFEAKQLEPDQLIELGHILQNARPPHFNQKLTLFKSVGLAIQDISIAHQVYENAIKKNLGFNYDLS